jgi:hypothetical protein
MGFLSFPPEIIIEILSKLDAKDILVAKDVSIEMIVMVFNFHRSQLKLKFSPGMPHPVYDN